MKKFTLLLALTLLVIGLAGYATQREVDDLRHEVERLKTQRDNNQQELQEDFYEAQTLLDSCKVTAEQSIDEKSCCHAVIALDKKRVLPSGRRPS